MISAMKNTIQFLVFLTALLGLWHLAVNSNVRRVLEGETVYKSVNVETVPVVILWTSIAIVQTGGLVTRVSTPVRWENGGLIVSMIAPAEKESAVGLTELVSVQAGLLENTVKKNAVITLGGRIVFTDVVVRTGQFVTQKLEPVIVQLESMEVVANSIAPTESLAKSAKKSQFAEIISRSISKLEYAIVYQDTPDLTVRMNAPKELTELTVHRDVTVDPMLKIATKRLDSANANLVSPAIIAKLVARSLEPLGTNVLRFVTVELASHVIQLTDPVIAQPESTETFAPFIAHTSSGAKIVKIPVAALKPRLVTQLMAAATAHLDITEDAARILARTENLALTVLKHVIALLKTAKNIARVIKRLESVTVSPDSLEIIARSSVILGFGVMNAHPNVLVLMEVLVTL